VRTDGINREGRVIRSANVSDLERPPEITRDVRLDYDQLAELLDAARRRRRELVKRNERMDGSKPGMIASNDRSIRALESAIGQLEPALEAVRRLIADRVARQLGVTA